MSKSACSFTSVILLVLAGCQGDPDVVETGDARFDLLDTPVGDVDFPVSCNGDAAELVERGVALLHHMMYDEARMVFAMARNTDTNCAMASWGEAMTIIHPLWPDTPTAEELARGESLIRSAQANDGNSERENAYIKAAGSYFLDGKGLPEAERLGLFEDAFRRLSDDYPDDLEAMAFYSLALRATASLDDQDLRIPLAAGGIAEQILAKNPNHPGAHHYIIHAYDYPELAERAVDVADHYGEISPQVPHASHMMTHIYTRLGQWQKAIQWNQVSADTAWQLCTQTGEINKDYMHALDYLAYAHLQVTQDEEVLEILATAGQLGMPFGTTNRDSSAYAFAALPARYALERRDWAAGANLQPRQPPEFPWEASHDAYVALTHFARAISLANSGAPARATQDIQALADIRERIEDSRPYWAKQIQIQEEAARAWQQFMTGDTSEGLDRMQHAASLEASTEKHAVTPGEVLPAAELYGDMLYRSGQFADAIEAYRRALERAPRRYNSLLGAARSAFALDDTATARSYYAELVSIAGDADSPRDSTREAQEFLQEVTL